MGEEALSCFILGVNATISVLFSPHTTVPSLIEQSRGAGKWRDNVPSSIGLGRMGDVRTSWDREFKVGGSLLKLPRNGEFPSQENAGDWRLGLQAFVVKKCQRHAMSISVNLTYKFLKAQRRTLVLLASEHWWQMLGYMYSPQGETALSCGANGEIKTYQQRYTVLWIVSGCGQRLNYIGPSSSNKTKVWIRSSGFFCSQSPGPSLNNPS